MDQFFPQGFWKAVAMTGVVVFSLVGLDLLFGARILLALSRTMNRKFQFDQIVVKALQLLKESSDREYDVEAPMLKGWGRFVVSAILFLGAAMMLMNLMPRL